MSQSRESTSTRSGHSRCRRQRRILVRTMCWLLGILSSLGMYAGSGLRLNLTGSMPGGLYVNTGDPLARGSIVLACLPDDVAREAMVRGYVPRGGSCPHGTMPLGKPVLALAGDTVIVTATSLVLNGELVPNSRSLSWDTNGRPLPALRHGKYYVSPGELWLVSTHSPFSFDSRYFGAVTDAQIRGQVRTLWVLSQSDFGGRSNARSIAHGGREGLQ